MPFKITSIQNPKIKGLRELHKAHVRKSEGLFLVEGHKEINLAQQSGFKLHSIFMEESSDIHSVEKFAIPSDKIFVVTEQVFEKIAFGLDREKIIAVFHSKSLPLSEIKLSNSPFILVLENVEKPGNIGAILRTADAAGVDAVIICNNQTDIYNSNVIRSSRGCIFTVPLAISTNEETYIWLKDKQVNILCAALVEDAVPYHDISYNMAIAVVFGAESQGLSTFWLSKSEKNLIIPMFGKIDSLNVSVSAAIITFEALRQRRLSEKNVK
jgi:TrmH family RNA methyltransferase